MPPRAEEICNHLCIHWVLTELRFTYRETGRLYIGDRLGETSVFSKPSVAFVCKYLYTATSRKVNMGYDKYTVPSTVAVEPTFVAFP